MQKKEKEKTNNNEYLTHCLKKLKKNRNLLREMDVEKGEKWRKRFGCL